MASTKKQATQQPKSAAKLGVGQKLERHELSEMFSLPTNEADRLALGLHIKSHEQINDIILFEGKVLDGWERYMSCLQQGITPKFREYKGADPAGIAFGANALRRKLSSVQKALLGAKYFIHAQENNIKTTQKDVAKLVSASLTRLNELVQLIRASDGNSEAARALSELNRNPDVTAAALQDMLVSAGIVDDKLQRPVTLDKPRAAASDGDGDDDLDDITDVADDSVDALGGADIDDMLDDDDDDEAGGKSGDGTKRTSSGAKVGVSKRPHETPASVCARNFRALTEPERADFVKFAWGMLRPALEKCIKEGRIDWDAAGVKADAGKAALGDVAAALAKQTALPAPAAETNKGKRHALVKSSKPAKAEAAEEDTGELDAVAKPAKKAAAKPATKPAGKRARKPASVDA